jgi:thioredoxin 1
MTVVAVTDASFEAEVLRSEIPVFVNLCAEGRPPCAQMVPVLEQLATELAGKVKFVKCDVERNPRVAQSFRVQQIPMLLVIDQGQIAGNHLGALDKAGVLKLLEPVMPAEASEVKPQELAQLLAAKRVVPVDIREASAFGRYRIPGAINVPEAELATRAEELIARDGRLRVLYGRTDVEAKEIAKKLESNGVQIGFLAGGFLHWEADGFEVERG